MDRRDFLKSTVGASVAVVAPPFKTSTGDLPTRVLGKTGVRVSVLAFGGGSHFLRSVNGDEETVAKLILRAIDLGINYFDTAASYTFKSYQRLSETYFGRILPAYRSKVFLASKSSERAGDSLRRSVEKSLELLHTDYLDLIQIHSLKTFDELDRIAKPDGAWPALLQLKKEGMVRFVGATGHYDPEVLYQAVQRFELDTLLVSLNAAQSTHPLSMTPAQPLAEFEDKVLPAANKKNVGVIAMKIMGQGSIVGKGEGKASPDELIRYALSLPVATIEISHTSLPILEQNVTMAKSVRPMIEVEMANLRLRLSGEAARWAHFLQNHQDGDTENNHSL